MARRKRNKRSIENPAVPLSSAAAYDYLAGRRSTAGLAVNRETVLGYPAVWRGVNLISDKVGRLPLHVYKRNKDGGRVVDTDHPAWWLLARRPSPLYNPFTFRKAMQAQALLSGNAYAWIVRDPLARPVELVLLDSEKTFPVMSNGQLWYVVRMPREERKLLPENVLHIRGLSHDGLVGMSVIDVLREAFGLGLAAQRYGSTFFRNNGQPGPCIIRLPGYLKDKEQVERFRSQWSKVHEGLDNSHRVALLEGGADVVNFAIDHDNLQFLQTRQFEVVQIANIFGVPPHKLGADISTSYGSLESEERAFLNDGLDGWLVQWEQECGVKLLKTSQAVRDSHFVEFDRLALEQADVVAQTTSIVAELNNGTLSLNEARAMRNRPGIGPDGDRLRMPAATVFIDEPAPEDGDEQPDADETPVGDPLDDTVPVEGNPAGGPGDVPDVGDQLRGLLAGVCRRLITRLAKDASRASRGNEWPHWLAYGLETHRGVIGESLAPVARDAADAVAGKLLDGLRAELEAVTRDQVGAVFQRLDMADDWARQALEAT